MLIRKVGHSSTCLGLDSFLLLVLQNPMLLMPLLRLLVLLVLLALTSLTQTASP